MNERRKELKEKVLGDARKKMGISEEKREAFKERIARVKEKTGETRKDAKATVMERRDERQKEVRGVKKEYDLNKKEARGVVNYANKNKTAATEGAAPTADYAKAKRVVEMAKNKGITRKEAAGIISSRRDARRAEQPGTITETGSM
jgi:hypothetical protein